MRVEPPVVSPRTLREAYALLAAHPHRPLAGGTDLLVQLTGEVGPTPDRVLDLWRIEDLRGIEIRNGFLELGALTSYTELRRSPACRSNVPALVEAAATIGAIQIQNRGTIGGNVMNASPAGDTLPVLLALDAVMVLGSTRGEREVPAADFWPAYRRTAAEPDELLIRLRIPRVAGRAQRFRKVGTRRAQAISKVVVATAWEGDAVEAAEADPVAPDVVRHRVRIALGSVAPTPIRAVAVEELLEGRRWDAAVVDAAVAAMAAAMTPIDDVRSTAAYRREAACRVVRRLLVEGERGAPARDAGAA